MPNFRFLACLELVQKFLVVGWGGVVEAIEAHFSVQLKPKPRRTILKFMKIMLPLFICVLCQTFCH